MKQNKTFIYGRHALVAALTNRPDIISALFVDPNKADENFLHLAKQAKIKISPLNSRSGLEQKEAHQGFIGKILVDRLVEPYDQFSQKLSPTPQTSLILLNEIQDPHNVGAIIRSAVAFGASGILFPRHNQAPITGTVIKVSAGMAFHIPLVEIGNTGQTIRNLKDQGFWIYGLDQHGHQPLPTESFDRPTVFVLGNEASGIREKTKDLCDLMLAIPMADKCESLNVAGSAAIALYAWSLKHPRK